MNKYCFGVDLGGTTVKLGLFDPEGTVLDKWEIPTRKEDNGSKILPDIAKAIEDKILIEEKNIRRKENIGKLLPQKAEMLENTKKALLEINEKIIFP